MALAEGKPVDARFAADFICTDQDVKDLTQPRPQSPFCLLEVPKDQLEALEAGGKFFFKALSGTDGFMALCSDTKTFGVEFLENSNSLFVGSVQHAAEPAAAAEGEAAAGAAADAAAKPADAKPADAKPADAKPADAKPVLGKCTIFAQVKGQLTVKQVNGDAQRIREILLPTALGQVLPDSAKLLSFSALLHGVAASAEELRAALSDGPYVEVDRFWRLLPERLEREIANAAISIVTANGWNAEAVDCEALLREVQQYLGDVGEASVPCSGVLRKALQTVLLEPKPEEKPAAEEKPADGAEKPAEKPAEEPVEKPAEEAKPAAPPADPSVISLDKDKMSRFRALQLLQESPAQVRSRFQLRPEPRAKRPRTARGGLSGPALQVGEFVAAFQALTGTEAKEEEVLKIVGDRVYVDEIEGTIHPIDPATLPQDAHGRLARLFDMQTHWRPERLASLLKPVMSKEQKVDVWLMKTTRAVHIELEPGQSEQRMLTRKFNIAGM